ncbi:MAG: DUF1349 domain-containing protein [Anaerolineae bacterium]|nr:DUF1349 domain-containing protein [Anaerolineae bacterium]
MLLTSVEFHWKNKPDHVETTADGSLTITAGPKTDWFFDPAGLIHISNAPIALFSPPDDQFLLSAKVTVEFASMFDAGVLMAYVDNEHWAKLCFEYAPSHKPMIVSVVTRGQSDDCNSVFIEDNTIYLRMYRQANALAFHYSEDSQYWHLVRYFSIGDLQRLHVGFSTQSPTGGGCRAHFSEIEYRPQELSDLRNGE